MNKRYMIIVGLLFMTAILTFLLSVNEPSQQNIIYAKQLPTIINDWYGKDIQVDGRTLEILETNDVLMRHYQKVKSLPVELGIVYAVNNRKVAHPPEVCFQGDGWSLEEKSPVLLSIKSDDYPRFRVIKLVMEKGNKKLLVLYWYKCNREYTSNYYRQQINIVMSEMKSGKSTSGLIRLSTMIINKDENGAMMRIEEFITDMLPLLTKYLP
ncbi:MAG: EpsI family protein [Candidatus Scalindua sp.]|nr:EpsI family protein [Candidatus Scalindua sp.]